MATLADLVGKICIPHQRVITVMPSGRVAFCEHGAGDLLFCRTEELKAWALTLNGHVETSGGGVAQTDRALGLAPPEGAGSKPAAGPGTTQAKPPEGESSEGLLGSSRAGLENSAKASAPYRNGQALATTSTAPPNSQEAEQSVLGAILLENEAMEAASRILKPDDFYRESHRTLFAAMQKLARAHKPIDTVMLLQALGKQGLESINGPGYLAELAIVVPTAQNVTHYAEIVRDMRIKRDVLVSARRLADLAMNGVTTDALLGEAARLLTPVMDVDKSNLPQLINRDIEVLSGAEFYARNSVKTQRSWLVDGFLAKKEISLWSGKVEAGKTTVVRTLVMATCRGDFFMDRHTYPAKILYVMLDADGEELSFEEFKALGFDPARDAIDFLIDPVMALRPNSFEQFHQTLLDRKPDLVVIDPLGRFQKIADFLGYETTYAMAQFSELAKRTDCHIALIHHIPRGRSDTDDVATAGFGSIAIAGGCNARFVCTKKSGGIYTLQSSKGKGGGFRPFEGEQVLALDPDTHWVTIKGLYDWKEQARAVEGAVLEAINQSDEPLSANEIGRAVHVQRSIAGSAAKSLTNQGLVTMIVGKANKHTFEKKGQKEMEFNDRE